jgi:hypothetical protein
MEGRKTAAAAGEEDADALEILSLDRARRRRMAITAHVAHAQFVIQVGHGNQTVKWLATAASQRFQRSMVNNGRLRQREIEGVFCAYVPSAITSPREAATGTPILPATFSPTDLIRDVFRDGDHVYVSLTEPGEQITRDNGAEVTSFQRAAFYTHPPHRRRARDFAKNVLARRRKPKKVSDSITARAVSDLFDQRHVQNTGELRKRCRQEFERSKIRQLVGKNDDDEDPELVFEVLAKYFHELEEIYMFFSTLDNGPINSMSLQEFQEFTKHCGMLDRDHRAREGDDAAGDGDFEEDEDGGMPSGLTLSSLGTIFAACNIEKDATGRVVHDPNNPSRELLRFEFLESVVRLAQAKYQTDRIMRDAPVFEKLERLCVEYISDYANEICERSLYLRERLSAPAVLAVFHDHLRMLKRVFKAYCNRDSGPVGGDKATAEAAAKLDLRRGSTRKMGGIVLTKSKTFQVEGAFTIIMFVGLVVFCWLSCRLSSVHLRAAHELFFFLSSCRRYS